MEQHQKHLKISSILLLLFTAARFFARCNTIFVYRFGYGNASRLVVRRSYTGNENHSCSGYSYRSLAADLRRRERPAYRQKTNHYQGTHHLGIYSRYPYRVGALGDRQYDRTEGQLVRQCLCADQRIAFRSHLFLLHYICDSSGQKPLIEISKRFFK